MSPISRRRFGIVALGTLLLGGCAARFATSYDDLPKATAQSWRLSAVRVTVPETLTVSEAENFVPSGDIVWRGDPPGDRRAQVAAVVKSGVTLGAQGLRGPVPVVFDVQVTGFHALSMKAYLRAPSGTGVNSTGFLLTVRRASDGAVLHGPVQIEADMPARLASEEPGPRDAANYGKHAKPEIIGQIAAVMRGWLGLGPDLRGSFSRAGR